MSGLHQFGSLDDFDETTSGLSVQPSVIKQITIICALGCC